MTNDILDKQLLHKERKLADLSRFVKTKAGNSANFSLLLGAGCSVTSGVRSAAELTCQWLQDEYRQNFQEEQIGSVSLEQMRDRLQKECAEWYAKDHEYSCLFEKRFDLPSQRRAFVEEEVAGKFPSIGYAYLIRLIEREYFNTVFTTNFDDLLNESFHLFSEHHVGSGGVGSARPIVCAHDSSVRSISITSARPKIIKLHGDYLFDDIKSSVRETESLEENMREKFLELSKEFGLIVVGYAGNDRSVMDVINYMLKSDDYVKNGIYWCLRRGDPVSDELKKLLWRDKVYYVYMDGFDEMLAELHHDLVSSDELPLSVMALGMNSNILETVVKNSEKYLKESKSDIINRDVGRLRGELDRNVQLATVKELMFSDREDADGRDISLAQMGVMLEIDRLMEKGCREEALAKIVQELDHGLENQFSYRVKLLRLRARVLRDMGRNKEALATCDKIMEVVPWTSYEHYRFKNSFITECAESIAHWKKYLERCPYDYRGYVNLTKEEFDLFNATYATSVGAGELLSDLNRGIACNPSVSNDCYVHKFDLLCSSKGRVCGSWKNEIQKILEAVKEQNPTGSLYFTLLIQCIIDLRKEHIVDDTLTLESVWAELKRGIEDAGWAMDHYLDPMMAILGEWDVKSHRQNFEQMRGLCKKGESVLLSSDLARRKIADFYLYQCADPDSAWGIYKKMSDDEYERNDMLALIDLMEVNKDDKFRSMCELKYKRALKGFGVRSLKLLELRRLEYSGDYGRALETISDLGKSQRYPGEYFTNEMHARLWAGDFQGVYDASQKLLGEGKNFNDNRADAINYQIARIKLERKVQKEKLESIATAEIDDEAKAAAVLLLGDEDSACSILSRVLGRSLRKALAASCYFVFANMGYSKVRLVVDKMLTRRWLE